MKYIEITVLVMAMTGLVLGAVIFSFSPKANQVETQATPNALPTPMNPNSATLAQREAVYQSRLTELTQILQDRQATYQTQQRELQTQITLAQGQLQQLTAQEQALLTQIPALTAARQDRQATYQAQLDQAQGQYTTRYAEWQRQLQEVQTQINMAKNQPN